MTDYMFDDYDFPLVMEHDARDLDELAILFERGYEDVPFTAAEEEMLPKDDWYNAHRALLDLWNLPLHRTEAGYPHCSTCDGGGCYDCTDPS